MGKQYTQLISFKSDVYVRNRKKTQENTVVSRNQQKTYIKNYFKKVRTEARKQALLKNGNKWQIFKQERQEPHIQIFFSSSYPYSVDLHKLRNGLCQQKQKIGLPQTSCQGLSAYRCVICRSIF